MTVSKVNIAIVGLGFGAEFIPIYQRHPYANMYAICQRSEKDLNEIGDAYGIDPANDLAHTRSFLRTPRCMQFTSIRQFIYTPNTLMALEAGKHVACTVPMATTIEDCKKDRGDGRENRP